MMRLMLVVLALVAVTGCRKDVVQTRQQTVMITETMPYECGEPPAVDPYKALPVQWAVQTLANGARVFTLTGRMYENLMTNMVNITASSSQLAAQRDFYVACVERSQQPPPVDEAGPES